MKVCPHCDNILEDDNTHCPYCDRLIGSNENL